MRKASVPSALTGLMFCCLAGMLSGQEVLHGDLDKSGTIDAADEVILRNYLAGNLDRIPAQAGQYYHTDPIIGRMRYVPAGSCDQGRELAGEPCNYGDENPFHHTLTRNMAVMEIEVTRRMWAELQLVQPGLPADPSVSGSSPDCPAQSVAWYEAILFANLLSVQNGLQPCYWRDSLTIPPKKVVVDAGNYQWDFIECRFGNNGYRLPTEGEWEYFCRAETTTPFSILEPEFIDCAGYCTAGSLPELESVAWFCANAGGQYHPAGQKGANPWGLQDIHGNVSEWCWDWYGGYPRNNVIDYHGPVTGDPLNMRTCRGGNAHTPGNHCRSATRGSKEPWRNSGFYTTIGFRLVRTVQ